VIPPIFEPSSSRTNSVQGKQGATKGPVPNKGTNRGDDIARIRYQIKAGQYPVNVERLATALVSSGELEK